MKKKYLSIISLFVVVFACKKPNEPQKSFLSTASTQTVSLSKAMQLFKNQSKIKGNLITAIMSTRNTSVIFGSPNGTLQNTNTSTNYLFRNYGDVTSGQNPNYANMYTYNYNGTVTGSGMAVRFPFKLGKNYIIELAVTVEGLDIQGESVDVKTRKPNLQVQLTNTAPSAGIEPPGPVTLVEPGPIQNITTTSSSHSLSFTPTECYDYVRFNARPNITGISSGLIRFSKIIIIETDIINIEGSAVLAPYAQETLSVKSSGLSINEQFSWTTTGNLEIVGSAIGPTAVVKSNGLNGGTVSISLNGCDNIATKVYTVTNPISIDGPDNVNSLNQNVSYTITGVPIGYQITWSQTGSTANATITNGASANQVLLNFTQYPDYTPNKIVSLKAIISDGVNPPLSFVRKIIVQYCSVCP